MTPTATPSAPSTPTIASPPAPSRRRRHSTFTSPWSATLLVLGLLGLAISGTLFAFRPAPSSPTGGRAAESAAVVVLPVPAAELTGLLVRGQPERWSSAEAKAVQEKRQGDMDFNLKAYRSAMQKTIYNQKNGWTDDGTERAGKGTPLRNSQKRGGDATTCEDAYMITAAACGGSDGDLGGGEGPEEGVTELGEL
jgi:hypothetical protein